MVISRQSTCHFIYKEQIEINNIPLILIENEQKVQTEPTVKCSHQVSGREENTLPFPYKHMWALEGKVPTDTL